jgi:hypothetical protein
LFCQDLSRFAEKICDFFLDEIKIDRIFPAEKKNRVFVIFEASGNEFHNDEPSGCENRNIVELDGFFEGFGEQLLKLVLANYLINGDFIFAGFDEVALAALPMLADFFERQKFIGNNINIFGCAVDPVKSHCQAAD